MAHFAQVDPNGIVVNILVGNNDEPDEGYQWLVDNLGGTWIKTSFNTRGGVHYDPLNMDSHGNHYPSADQSKALRKNYAVVGGTYDAERDAFISPKPFPSYILNETTCLWEAPVPNPTREVNLPHYWSEEEQMWKLVPRPE
jgi:hypothetical protein